MNNLYVGIMWRHCYDLGLVNDAINNATAGYRSEDWAGLTDASQIISITYDNVHKDYVVIWRMVREVNADEDSD